MSQSVSEFVVSRMHAWGVRRVFGYPGDGINGVLGALNRAQDRIRFIQTRHEEMAAFMACGHAKFTGEVGTCLATSGPGAIHLLAGLYDAKADRQPVVAIVGQQSRSAIGGQYQQEVDLPALFKDVAHEFVYMATTPAQVRSLIDGAYRTAIAERTPTCVILPTDLQSLPYREPPHEHGTVHTGLGYFRPSVVPPPPAIEKAAEVLNAGNRVAILIGVGAAGAAAEVLETAEVLGAGIAKALLGKPVLPDVLPHVTGGIGLLGTTATHRMITDCDTLLMIGSRFPYSEFLPEEGTVRGVQIDIDGRNLGLRYPMEVNLTGDAALTLRALLPLLHRKSDRGWRKEIERNTARWRETLERRAMNEATPLNPQRVFHELSPHLPGNAMIACDTGTTVHWYSRHLDLREGMWAAHSGGLASMGAAIPYAIAAKFAHPDRPAIALVGDGAMQMNGMNELITVAKYRHSWEDPRFIVLVMNNRDLNMVSWEQRVLEGEPKFPASQDVPDFPYVDYARLLGFEGVLLDRPQDLAGTWERVFRADRPVLVEAVVDPNVVPLPPHVTPSQARNYLKSLLNGDPDAKAVVKASIRELFT